MMRWWLSCSLHPTMKLSVPENLDSLSRYSSTTSSFIRLEFWTVTSPVLPSLQIISPHGFSHIEKWWLIVWAWTSKLARMSHMHIRLHAGALPACLRIHDIGMHCAIVNYSSVYGCLSSYDFTFWVSTAYTGSMILSLLPSIIYSCTNKVHINLIQLDTLTWGCKLPT